MKAFITHLVVQFRGDSRDKGILMVYYLVPLVFYVVMSSIMKLPEMNMSETLISSISIFTLSMSAFLGLPQTLVKARETGVLQAFRVAGIPSWSMPLSAIIISLLHIMIVACIILLTAPVIFSATLPSNIALHMFSVALIALASEALGVLLACFVKKQSTLTLAGQCLFLPTVMLSGIMFPANILPKPMRMIGEVLPASLGMKLISGGVLQTAPLLILIAITVFAFGASMVMFRRINMKV
jgi:ABC-2 type transport system permease protein